MRFFFLSVLLSVSIAAGAEPQILSLKVRDEVTTFPAVESSVGDNGRVYWGEKAIGTLFGATPKSEGENLVILCREKLCVPFYKDDPHKLVIEQKGKPLLLAPKVAEAFGYKRFEFDRASAEIRLFKNPKPPSTEPTPITAPGFSLPDTAGNTVSLSQLKGKNLLMLVWAPWDKGRDTLPGWNRLAAELGDKIQFLLVAETIEERSRLEPYLSILKPRPVCLVDSGFRITLLYGLKELPSVLLIDVGGNLVWGPVRVSSGDAEFHKALLLWTNAKRGETFSLKNPTTVSFPPPAAIEEAAKRIELAEILWCSGKKEEALREYRRVVKEYPAQEIFNGQLHALTQPNAVYPTPTPAQGKGEGKKGNGKRVKVKSTY